VPPDSVRCTRGERLKLFTFGFLESRSAIIHRTVWCATGATTIERNGQLQRSPANVNSARTVHADSEQRQKAHRTVNSPVRCGTGLSGAPRCQSSNGQNRQNLNGWVTWLVHRTVSGSALDCPVCPSTDSLPNGWFGGWGYKYPPTTTTPRIHVFQTSHSIQELVQSIQDTIQKNQSLSKSQIHSKHLVTRERVLLVFFELLFLDRFLLPILVLQALVIKARDTNCVVVLVGSK
jgi:hypothetical protein